MSVEHDVPNPTNNDSGKETSEESQSNQLRDYEQVKFELAGLIREASSAAWYAKQEPLQRDFQDVLRRLAEDRFYLTLAGQFSRGKTSLLNAMLGMDRLPTGVVPVTSVITAVSYSPNERVRMHFENSGLSYDVPLAELSEWITEEGNPGNQRRIDMAEVQLPSEFLRRGAFFVDTPGLGSAIIENTATTHRFLPQIDALILVTSFEFPLSQEELFFLRKAKALRRKIFVVINKLDLCPQGEQEKVLNFIRLRFTQEGLDEAVPMFPLSAAHALAARSANDRERLERSGLPQFERALVSYLIEERSRDFLMATCDRIESLLTTSRLSGVKELGQRVQDMRTGVLSPEQRQREGTAGASEPEAEPLGKVSSCFVCRKMADATFKFISQFQYALSHSREEQMFHASRSGFCSLHTREYARLASPQGIASGYPRTLTFLAEHLRMLVDQGELREGWRDQFEAALPDHHKCRACQVVAETEEAALSDFVRSDSETPSTTDNLPGVCLRHLFGIVQKTAGTSLAKRMIIHAAEMLQRTAENMERFALRHGGMRIELASDEDWASPEKGLNLLVGQPNVRPGGVC